jgi:nucleoside phosphorylase
MVIVTFAVKEEGISLVRRLSGRQAHEWWTEGALGEQRVAVVFVGIGLKRREQLGELIDQVRPAAVLGTGFSGATQPFLKAGNLVFGANCSSDALIKRVRQEGEVVGAFRQVDHVCGPEEKRRLSSGTLAIDMESQGIHELCVERNTPLLTARMISDQIDESIPAIFLGKPPTRIGDHLAAVRFALRMLMLRERLARRVVQIVGELGRV